MTKKGKIFASDSLLSLQRYRVRDMDEVEIAKILGNVSGFEEIDFFNHKNKKIFIKDNNKLPTNPLLLECRECIEMGVVRKWSPGSLRNYD